MKRLFPIILLFSFLLSACGAEATPTVNPEYIKATANAMVYAMLTETQAAMPTFTSVPPTSTATLLPTETPTLIPTTEIVESPTLITVATNTQAVSSTEDACNHPLGSWGANDVKFTVTNTVPKSTAVLSLYVLTETGECGYLSFSNITKSSGGTIPAGCYSAFAWVDGAKKDFSAGTNFCVTGGSWELVIKEGRLVLYGGCYPNC